MTALDNAESNLDLPIVEYLRELMKESLEAPAFAASEAAAAGDGKAAAAPAAVAEQVAAA